MLDIIVSKPGVFGATNFEEYKKVIDKAIEEGHTPIIIKYLQGDVESVMGYDIALCLNGEECADLQKEQYKEGIYDAKVRNYNNLCRAFLWNTNKPRGLIVDTLDIDSLEYAEEKYKKKESFL